MAAIQKTNPKGLFTRPPNDCSSRLIVQSYEKMLKRLGIHPTESTSDEIFSMNVGGDRLITRKKTLMSRSFKK